MKSTNRYRESIIVLFKLYLCFVLIFLFCFVEESIKPLLADERWCSVILICSSIKGNRYETTINRK